MGSPDRGTGDRRDPRPGAQSPRAGERRSAAVRGGPAAGTGGAGRPATSRSSSATPRRPSEASSGRGGAGAARGGASTRGAAPRSASGRGAAPGSAFARGDGATRREPSTGGSAAREPGPRSAPGTSGASPRGAGASRRETGTPYQDTGGARRARPQGERERGAPERGAARTSSGRAGTSSDRSASSRGAGSARGAAPARGDVARRGAPAAADGAERVVDPRREERRRAADVPLPEDVDPEDLDKEVRADLRPLAPATRETVARHLVVVGRLLDEDPDLALRHARAARALAGRVAHVREAAGLAAYAAGEWAEALTELRTARRISGRPDHLPVVADCERALGRPERALALTEDPQLDELEPATRAELMIVLSGARRDLGQAGAAVLQLREAARRTPAHRPWAARLWYAYADALLDDGRSDEAREWFARAADADADGSTDAAERLLEMDGFVLDDTDAGADADPAEDPADDTADGVPSGSADDLPGEAAAPAGRRA